MAAPHQLRKKDSSLALNESANAYIYPRHDNTQTGTTQHDPTTQQQKQSGPSLTGAPDKVTDCLNGTTFSPRCNHVAPWVRCEDGRMCLHEVLEALQRWAFRTKSMHHDAVLQRPLCFLKTEKLRVARILAKLPWHSWTYFYLLHGPFVLMASC